MYLQGDLQTVFDALYHMGVIDPVLEMDWGSAIEEMRSTPDQLVEVVAVVNSCQDDVSGLMRELRRFDQRTLGYLAMEVAREFADYHARDHLQ